MARPTSVARIALNEAGSLVVPPGDVPLLGIVTHGGAVVGEVHHPAHGALAPPSVRERVYRLELIAGFRRATRGGCPPELVGDSRPSVSVVVVTKERPGSLRGCLTSLAALRSSPDEVLVIDGSDDGGLSRAVSSDFAVRYVPAPGSSLGQARNGGLMLTDGELVAFIDDDCRVEAGWLDGIGEPFADPMLAAVAGYVGPLDLRAREQRLFDAREAPRRRYARERVGGLGAGLVDISYRNAVFRRDALAESGGFADHLGPGTNARGGHDMDLTYRIFASGYSVLVEPSRVAWHWHPAEEGAAERALVADFTGGLAGASRCLAVYRDPLASTAMLRSTVSAALGAARCMTIREPGSSRRMLAGALMRAIRERRSLARGLVPRRDERPVDRMLPRRQAEPSDAAVRREQPRLTVVVPTYNRRALLHEVLVGLGRQHYAPELFEVVVVVDGSTDQSGELARSLETPYELRVLEQGNRGLAATRNRGAQEAREELLVFLDDDLLPEPGFLAAHAAGHETSGRESVVLGFCPPVDGAGGLWRTYFRAIWDLHYRCKAQRHHRWTYADIVGGNCSMTRSLVLESGGWDERFSRREDWELGVRLLRHATTFTYEPGARAWHHFDSTLATELRKREAEGRDDVYFASKHPELRAQLPLAAYVHAAASASWRLAFRNQDAIRSLLQSTVRLANALEVARARRQWVRLVELMLAYAYFVGVAEATGTPRRLTEFLAPVARGDSIQTLDVALGTEGCLQVPPGAGALDLVVRLLDSHSVRVRAVEPEGQWDWESIEDRLLRELGDGSPE